MSRLFSSLVRTSPLRSSILSSSTSSHFLSSSSVSSSLSSTFVRPFSIFDRFFKKRTPKPSFPKEEGQLNVLEQWFTTRESKAKRTPNKYRIPDRRSTEVQPGPFMIGAPICRDDLIWDQENPDFDEKRLADSAIWKDYRPEFLQRAMGEVNASTGVIEGEMYGEHVVFPELSPTLEWACTTPVDLHLFVESPIIKMYENEILE